jgi:hypothetical protein
VGSDTILAHIFSFMNGRELGFLNIAFLYIPHLRELCRKGWNVYKKWSYLDPPSLFINMSTFLRRLEYFTSIDKLESFLPVCMYFYYIYDPHIHLVRSFEYTTSADKRLHILSNYIVTLHSIGFRTSRLPRFLSKHLFFH